MARSQSFEDVYTRLLQASRTKNDSELSRILSLTPQSINGARKRGEIPPSWIQSYAETSGVSSDWLFFGRGPMRPGEATPTAQEGGTASLPVQENACARCVKLETRLDSMELERRELTAENRELTLEVRHLWKENGELREKCARLEERQYQRTGHVDRDAVGSAG